MNQNEIAILFNRSRSRISNITLDLKENVDDFASVCSQKELTGSDGKTYKMSLFNLDVVRLIGNKIDPLFTAKFIDWCKEQLKSNNNQIIPIESNKIRFEKDGISLDVNVSTSENAAYLTKEKPVTLFDTTRQLIEYHLENIFDSCELDKEATCKEILQVQLEDVLCLEAG